MTIEEARAKTAAAIDYQFEHMPAQEVKTLRKMADAAFDALEHARAMSNFWRTLTEQIAHSEAGRFAQEPLDLLPAATPKEPPTTE